MSAPREIFCELERYEVEVMGVLARVRLTEPVHLIWAGKARTKS